MSTEHSMERDGLRKDVVDLLDQFGFNVSSKKLYSSSAEMNAEIMVAANEFMAAIDAYLAAEVRRAELTALLMDSELQLESLDISHALHGLPPTYVEPLKYRLEASIKNFSEQLAQLTHSPDQTEGGSV